MSSLLNVEIVTREEDLWLGAASHVGLPALDGRLGVLPGRQPLLTVLGEGIVDATTEGGEIVKFHVKGGFASVDADYVTVVVPEGGPVED